MVSDVNKKTRNSASHQHKTCLRAPTHQILADKHPDKDSEQDAADEPEDSERIELLWIRASVLGRFLASQLTSQFHGVVKTREVLLKTSARGAAEIVRRPLPPGSLSNPSDLVLQKAPGRLAAVWQGRAPPLWGGTERAAAKPRGLRQEGRRPGGGGR